jgi:integrase
MAGDTNRFFEHEGYWLARRQGSPFYYIACMPLDPGSRSVYRFSTGTPDLEEAKRRLVAHAAANPRVVHGGEVQRPERGHSEPVIIDLLSDYVDRLRETPSYRSAELPILKRWTHFLELNDVVFVSELTRTVQERYVAWRRQMIKDKHGTVSNGTLIRDLGVLKAALRYAWKDGRLTHPPYVIGVPSPPPRSRFLTEEEARRLIEHCDEPHLRLYVMLALQTMQRPIAIFSLKTSQVDLVNNRIDFLPPGKVQSKKRRPVVPITSSLRAELEWAVENSISGYVVEWQGQPVKRISTAFRSACKRANLEGVCPYTLRHTAATLAASRGVPLREIAGFLGHTTERTTELYAKHSPDFLGRAAHALDELFGLQRADQCRPQPVEANTETVDIIGVCAGAAEKNRTSDPTLTKHRGPHEYHISTHFEIHPVTLNATTFLHRTAESNE